VFIKLFAVFQITGYYVTINLAVAVVLHWS